MTPQEQLIWNLVHNWCNQQSLPIPNLSRIILMDKILELINNKSSNNE